MSDDEPQTSRLDPRFPTTREQDLIASDVVIAKTKFNDTNIQSSFHTWRDIWDDGLVFRVQGLNPDYQFRAVALTLPMYILDDPNATELTHRGYITGIRVGQGQSSKIQWFPAENVVWVNDP